MKVSEFEFPATVISNAVPNDVVFCGKVITRRSQPGSPPQNGQNRILVKSESFGRTKKSLAWLRSASGKESRCRKSESCRKHYNGMFGTVKFPLQMELSDIKMRRDRREPPPPSSPVWVTEIGDGDGGESCWEIVRPLKRVGILKNPFFRCFLPIV